MNAQMRIRRDRRGFTLIELVIVLLVLAGLAGILVPVVQNMVVKTHGSAGASNIAEVAKAIQLFEAQTLGSHPNGYDQLIDEAGNLVAGDLHLTAVALTDDDADALADIGIDTVYEHLSTAENRTFEPYAPIPVAITLADTIEVAQLNADGIAALGLVGLPGDYVAFGVGAFNTAIGKTILEAPVHFPEGGQDTPLNSYSRFLAIYQLPAEGPARLATVAAVHDGELASLGKHLNEYYETQLQP